MVHELNMHKPIIKKKSSSILKHLKKKQKKKTSKAREKTDKNKTAKEAQAHVFTDEIKADRKNF